MAEADHVVVARRRFGPASPRGDPGERPGRHPVVDHDPVTRGPRSADPGGRRPSGSRDASADAYALRRTLAAPLVVDSDRPRRARPVASRWRTWPAKVRGLLDEAAEEASIALPGQPPIERAETRASTDALTGLPNRRYFDEFCALLPGAAGPTTRRRHDGRHRPLQAAQRHARPRRRRQVLRAVAGAIAAAVRDDDVPARYGGEEFAVLLREPSRDGRGRGRRARPRAPSAASTCAAVASPRSPSRSAWPSRAHPTSRSTSSSSGPTRRSTGQARGPRPGRRRLTRVATAAADVGAVRCRRSRTPADRSAESDRPRASRGPPSDDAAPALPDQRRARARVPRDRRHARGQGRARLQDGRLPPGRGRHRPAARSTSRGLSRRDSAARSRASARPSATSSPSSRRPATCVYHERLRGRGAADASSTLLRSRASGPRPSSCSTRARRREPRGPAAGRRSGRVRTVRGCHRETEQAILDGHRGARVAPRRGCSSHGPRSSSRRYRPSFGDVPGVRLDRAGRLVPPPSRDDRRPRPARRDRRPGGASSRGSRACRGRRAVARGGAAHKAAVTLLRGPQVDLMIMPPGAAGTYLDPFHGSARSTTSGCGRWPATAAGACPSTGSLRLGDGWRAADRRRSRAADVRRPRPRRTPSSGCRSSSPSCARTRARSRPRSAVALPTLVSLADLRGDLHTHSEWSDGVHPIEAMAEAGRGARPRLPGPDRPHLEPRHRPRPRSGSLRRAARHRRAPQRAVRPRGGRGHGAGRDVAGGLPPAPRLRARDPRRRRPRSRRRRCSTRFDLVVASLHVGRRQPRDQLDGTGAGRDRQPACRRHRPSRRSDDPGPRRPRPRLGRRLRGCRAQRDRPRDERLAAPAGSVGRASPASGGRGLPACRSTRDAHRTDELDDVRWGVSQARRAWVEPATVLNTRSRAELLEWVDGKSERLAAARRPVGLTGLAYHRDPWTLAASAVAISPCSRPPRSG